MSARSFFGYSREEYEAGEDCRRELESRRPKPTECPVCEYDRRFPGFEDGGWMQQDNNGPICVVSGVQSKRRAPPVMNPTYPQLIAMALVVVLGAMLVMGQ